MIGRLEGSVHQVKPGEVIVDVGGVGYRVSTTLRIFHELSRSERVVLWIHTNVRSDAIVLYGFGDLAELEAFERLIAVAGVGPRTALAVLSALTPGELAEAVDSGDIALLERTPGVGRKTAERIQLELKGKIQAGVREGGDRRADAVSALVNLGYGQRDARRAVDAVLAEEPATALGEVLRMALQRLTRK
jgi:Holliday junction DNA helicase RuvA